MANVLGAPEAPAMSMDERLHHLFARMPDAKVHLYGKGERKDRKIGHVNVLGAASGSIDEPGVRGRGARARGAGGALAVARRVDRRVGRARSLLTGLDGNRKRSHRNGRQVTESNGPSSG